LPQFVVARIRNHTNIRIFLLQAYVVFYAFAAAASRSDWPSSFLDDPWAFLRMAIPAGAVLIVLLLRNAWSDPEQTTPLPVTLDVTAALGLAILSQRLLAVPDPSLALPRWRATQGSAVGWFFLMGLRAGFPPHAKIPGHVESVAPMRPEKVQWKAGEFEREFRLCNRIGYPVAAAVIALFAFTSVRTNALAARIGAGLVIVGTLCIVMQVLRTGSPEASPQGAAFNAYCQRYRRELESRRVLLRQVRFWYIGSAIPGIVLLLLGSRFYEYFVLMPLLLLAELTHRAIQRIEREIADFGGSGME
jgi:hypothetical protein